jgi:ABC-three component (ABC-3C) system Middle Component 6
MLVDKDTNPERDVYYLGAKVIEVMSEHPEIVGFFDIFEKVNSYEEVSLNLYSLSLDWLYIVGVIKSSGEGHIEKCF